MTARTRTSLHRLITAFMTLALLLGPQAPVHALTVSPPVYDYTLNPGDIISDTIKVYNESSDPLTVYPETFNFTYTEGDEVNGTPSFYPANVEKNGHELAPWIQSTGGTITLQPTQHSSINFTITVPQDAQPGSHFGSIQLRSAPSGSEQPTAVGVVGGLGVLILVRISGKADDNVRVARFSGDKVSYAHLPVDLAIRLDNQGNTHVRPTGNVFITDMFGRQTASIPVNSDFHSILPGSARRFDVRWQKKRLSDNASELQKEWSNFAFGRYTAALDLNYGPPSAMKHLTGEYSFWVVPWMFLSLFGVGIALIVFLLMYGLKRYNRMIIKRYEDQKRTDTEG
jgi:hypothetical protein